MIKNYDKESTKIFDDYSKKQKKLKMKLTSEKKRKNYYKKN